MSNIQAAFGWNLHETRRLYTAFTVAAGLQLGCAAMAQAAPLAGTFSGGARTVAAGAAVDQVLRAQIGTAAHIGCPCRGTRGVTLESKTASVLVGPAGAVLTATAADSTAYADKTATTATSAQSSTVSKVSLLGGLITADTLKAVASVGATPGTLTTSDTGTLIANLTIGGSAIDPNVPDNTVVPLPGLGSVTIKAVNSVDGKQKAHVTVDMLLVSITEANRLGLAIGAKLIVAEASAGYSRDQPQTALTGFAVGAAVKADAGGLLQDAFGAGSAVGLPGCAGSDGQTLTRSVTNINVPHVLLADTETTTALGGVVGNASVAKTTSTLSNISLLNGLIRATSLAAAAQESRTGNVSTSSAEGSGFGGLVVAGVPIAANIPPNTKLALLGLGYVIINEQIKIGLNGFEVNGLHVVVDVPNLLKLPVGAEIFLSHAAAAARHF